LRSLSLRRRWKTLSLRKRMLLNVSSSSIQDIFLHVYGRSDPGDCGETLTTCGYRKFQLDPLGDHLNTCTAHSGAKKAHDWMVDQLPDLFRTTHKVKTHQVVKSRGQHCGDIELAGYLGNEADPVPLVLDLRIAHDRVGSSADPTLNGHLKYPNNLDQSLNDAVVDKIRKYCADYNNRPPSAISFMPVIASTSGRLHSEFVRLLFLQAHRETDLFFASSGVQPAQTQRVMFHFRRTAFSSGFKSKVGLTLAKAARCSTSTTNPVCARHINLLVCSLPLHRHSYIGFLFSFCFIDS
jgi:hypothetical protein